MLRQVRRDSCVLHLSRSNVCSCMSRTHIYVTNSCVCHELIECNVSVDWDMWDVTHAWLNSSEVMYAHACHKLIHMSRTHLYVTRTHIYVTNSSKAMQAYTRICGTGLMRDSTHQKHCVLMYVTNSYICSCMSRCVSTKELYAHHVTNSSICHGLIYMSRTHLYVTPHMYSVVHIYELWHMRPHIYIWYYIYELVS